MAQTAITQQQKQTIQFRDYLDARRGNLATVLPKHLTPERVIKIALAAYSKTPKLRECSMDSVYAAVLQAAELGLEPGGALGHAYLVPYGQTCTFIPGYRGLIELARRSGEIESIEAHVVYERDTFKLRFGLDLTLEHEPYLDGDPGKLRFVYGIARLKGGERQVEVMTKAQIDAIRARSRSGNNGPWVSDYEEMARKTVVRRLCKYLPLSPERAQPLSTAIEHDESDLGPIIDVVPTETETKAESRTAAVLERVQQAQQPEPSKVQIIDVDEHGEPIPPAA